MGERIRTAIASDARALAQLRWDFRSARGGAAETEAEFLTRCETWMANALNQARWKCFAAEIDATIVGQLWIQLVDKIPNPAVERERHAYITNIYVRPEHRGSGIAGRLLMCARTWCEKQRVDTMFLWPSNLSRPLYLRHGFDVSDAIFASRLED